MGILDNLFGAFRRKDESVIGIDIGSSAIKVVQLKKKKGKAILETYGELALGPYAGVEMGRATNLTTDKVAEALVDVLRESHSTTKNVGISIPLGASFITFMNMPAMDQKRLAEMVPIEARKYVPLPINEVLLDWWVIPKDDTVPGAMPEHQPSPQNRDIKEMIDVLVVAIHNEMIGRYQDISQRASLASSFYEIELFSTIRSVIEHGLETQMVMDMGAGTTKLYIVERGILRNSHTINRGSQDITIAISQALNVAVSEAETMKRTHGLTRGPEHKDIAEIITLTCDYIFYEANRVLLNYQKKYNKSINKVILTGGGVLLKGFRELAEKNFETSTMLGKPFSKVEAPAFLEDVLTVAGPEFAVAVGAALRKLSEVA
jgi:type IV pilus assembly protein PilM